MRFLRVVSTASIAICAVACAAIWGFDDLKPSGSNLDGGKEGGEGSAGDAGPPCNLDHPDDPGATNPGGGINFLSAVDSFDIGTHRDGGADASRTIAYDLDGVCTCHGTGQESCIRTSGDPLTCDDDR